MVDRHSLKFGYRATTSAGSIEQGTVTADSLAAAERVLRGKRLFPLEISEIQGELNQDGHSPLKLQSTGSEAARLEKLLGKLATKHSHGKSNEKTKPKCSADHYRSGGLTKANYLSTRR